MEPQEVRYIVVHCSATPPGMDVDAAMIDRWHRQKGWRGIGYHYVIKRIGIVENGRPLDMVGAHVEGYNAESIGICMAGGIDASGAPENNFTPAQFKALARILDNLLVLFPKARIVGHRDLNPKKACPSFDVGAWWAKENA